MQFSIAEKVRAEIAAQPGWVFTVANLEHLNAPQNTVERTLARLAERGSIRRISQGLYHYPQKGKIFATLPPKPEHVAQALTTAQGAKLVASGAMALHRLGLTTQVPMKHVYLTNRHSRTERLGNLTVELKQVSERHLSGAGTRAGEVLSAIEYVGRKEAAARDFIGKVARKLSAIDIQQLEQAAAPRTIWVQRVAAKIIETWRSLHDISTGSDPR